jgi:hypothetical protein
MNNKRIFKIILYTLLISSVALGALYIFVWRPSDSSYQELLNATKTMTETQSKINSSIGSITNPSELTSDFISIFANNVDKYNSAFKSASDNDITSRDVKIKNLYDKDGVTLNSYGNSAQSLSDSLKAYQLAEIECIVLTKKINTISTVKEFDDAASDCKAAIDSAKLATNAAFKEQFLGAYLDQLTALVSAYRQVIVQTEAKTASISLADVLAINKNLVSSQQKQLTLTPSPNVSKVLSELTRVTSAQKGALIR